MQRRNGVLAVMLAVVLASSTALARWEIHRGANVRFNVPDGWAMATEGSAMVIRPPQGGMAIEFHALTNPAQFAAVDRALLQVMQSRFQSARYVGQPTQIVQNGLRGVAVRGVGLRNGQMYEWFALAIGANGRGIIAAGFAQQGQLEANVGTVRAVLNSIQPNS